jgi:hypothetical protein
VGRELMFQVTQRNAHIDHSNDPLSNLYPFVVSSSNHEHFTLRLAQGERDKRNQNGQTAPTTLLAHPWFTERSISPSFA